MIDLCNGLGGWSSSDWDTFYQCDVQKDGSVLLVEHSSRGAFRQEFSAIMFDSIYEMHELRPDVEIPFAMLNTWDPTNGSAWWLPLKLDLRFEKPPCTFPCAIDRACRKILRDRYKEVEDQVLEDILAARARDEQPAVLGCRLYKKASCTDDRCPCPSVITAETRNRLSRSFS